MVTSLACAAARRRTLPLVLAVFPPDRGSQRSPVLRVMPLTHLMVHLPSWWPGPAALLVSTPLPPLLYRFDTIPSATSSFRTSLLVYHLLSLSPNVWNSHERRAILGTVL